MSGPTQDFWQARFASGAIPWDRGTPNPQLLQWIANGMLAPGMQVAADPAAPPGTIHGPPYPEVKSPVGRLELAVVLTRK